MYGMCGNGYNVAMSFVIHGGIIVMKLVVQSFLMKVRIASYS